MFYVLDFGDRQSFLFHTHVTYSETNRCSKHIFQAILSFYIKRIFTEVLIIWKKLKIKINIYENFQMLEAGADEKQLMWQVTQTGTIKLIFLHGA